MPKHKFVWQNGIIAPRLQHSPTLSFFRAAQTLRVVTSRSPVGQQREKSLSMPLISVCMHPCNLPSAFCHHPPFLSFVRVVKRGAVGHASNSSLQCWLYYIQTNSFAVKVPLCDLGSHICNPEVEACSIHQHHKSTLRRRQSTAPRIL